MDEKSRTTQRILIVDDDSAVVRALAVRCRGLGLEVYEAHDAVEAMKVIHTRPAPDLLLLDFGLPGADGLTLCDMIRTDGSLAPLPVILLTGHTDEDTRRRCEQSGAYFVAKDPQSWNRLEPLIRRLLDLDGTADCDSAAEASPSRRRTILLIDDDLALIRALRVRLQSMGYAVLEAGDGMQGYWLALKHVPDLILLDYKMPEARGNTVLGKLKSNPLTRRIKVIILSGVTDHGLQRDILRLGAECWINKPYEVAHLVETVREHIGAPKPATSV